jgi:hypothetical protein
LFTAAFWKDVLERLLATLAQVALGLLTADGVSGVNLEVWVTTLAVAGLGVVLKALVASKVSDTLSPASLASGPDSTKSAPATEVPSNQEPEPAPALPEPVVEAPVALPRKRAPRKKVD